jgi:DNA-binding transcriptional ArsR family regulator
MVKYQDPALDRTFAALADRIPRALLAQLGERQGLSVSEPAKPFPVSLPAIMKHLDVLSDAGLIARSKAGRIVACRLTPQRAGAAPGWLPFDGKRMIYGGFESLIKARAALRRSSRPALFALDRAVDGVDQRLGFDEFDARPLGLVAVERRGQHLCERVAILRHTIARFFQRLKSLVHGFHFLLPARQDTRGVCCGAIV